MSILIEEYELPVVTSIANNPESVYHAQAKLLLLIHKGSSVRQAADQTGYSPSGVQYWVTRFRRLRLDSLQETSNLSTLKSHPSSQEKKRKKKNKMQNILDEPASQSLKDSFIHETLTKPGILTTDSMAAAGKKTLRFHFFQMVKNEKGTIEGQDIEALHDMRVATRRMRAALDVFIDEYDPKSIKPIMKGLKQTGRNLGEVRDLDVILDKAEKYITSQPEAKRIGLDPLIDFWKAQREQNRQTMIIYLEGTTYRKFLLDFSEFLGDEASGIRVNDSKKNNENETFPTHSQVRYAVPLLIYTRMAHVSAFETSLNNASLTQLHALRIELKRMRYSLEFFSEVLGKEAVFVINEIKILQDHLGDLNDAYVACNMLSEILAKWDDLHNQTTISERPNPEPIVAYLAFRADERHRLLVSFPTAWERFTSPEVRKKLALAISAL